MIETVPSTCVNCGAQSNGVSFCENCGAQISAASVVTERYSSRTTVLNVLTLAFYIVSFVTPTTLSMLSSTPYGGSFLWNSVGFWLGVVFGVLAGIAAGFAALVSRGSRNQRVIGAILGFLFAFAILTLNIPTGPYFSFGFGFGLESLVGLFSVFLPFLLFFSWAIARPFRGPGYIALAIGVAIAIPTAIMGIITSLGSRPDNDEVIQIVLMAVFALVPVVTVVFALLFEKRKPSLPLVSPLQ